MKSIKKVLAGLCLFSTTAFAQEKMGPAFGIGSEVSDYPNVQWIQGEPVKKFDKNKIYIIECWATWCGPCKAAIPRVNELHKKFGDKIVIIGQDIWETNLKKVQDFVKKEGNGMSYRIAYGGGQESDFSLKFMKAAGQTSIPHTFVIQDNKVVWMPEPSELSEEALQLLIDRKFNIDAAKALNPAKKYEDVRLLMGKEEDYDKAMLFLDSILQKYPFEDTGVMMKWVLYTKMKKPADAINYLKKAYDQHPTSTIKYLYYKTLQDNKQWDVLAEETKSYLKENPGDDADAAEAMIAAYAALSGKEDFKGAAALLNTFIIKSKNPVTLMRFAFIDKLVKSDKADPAVQTVMLKAGEKSLMLDPANLMLIAELVKRNWKNNDKVTARKLTARTITSLRKDASQQRLTGILEEIADMLDKDVLPTEAQFKSWEAESKK
ncbi:TlpA disulfide reductase family protein [Pedobacter nyackensis]|uniref:TlpA disulfide reductase family protein n=1 Tax=Pedobacter nyackensis TaxID=475255 RepID=UPI00292D5C3B|nr:TlpA disulfide reductase family protein [Pedobacter nyackensis]